jgi:hypothetical protein
MTVNDEIVKAVKDKKCILFLGAMASAKSPDGCKYVYDKAPPGGGELSELLAKRSDYMEQDTTNLQRVALHFQFREPDPKSGVMGSREGLIDFLKEKIHEPGFEPSPALRMLAALPFPIVITTNYDGLFDAALSEARTQEGRKKNVIKLVYQADRKASPPRAPLDPTADDPVLMKLHGDLNVPESVVITEEDYLQFVYKMSDRDRHPLHENLRARMNSWRVLFIGYSLKDYNLRLLFRTLKWQSDVASIPLSFSVDPKPDDLIVSVFQKFDTPQVSFVKQNLWDFVPALYEACMGKEYKVEAAHERP